MRSLKSAMNLKFYRHYYCLLLKHPKSRYAYFIDSTGLSPSIDGHFYLLCKGNIWKRCNRTISSVAGRSCSQKSTVCQIHFGFPRSFRKGQLSLRWPLAEDRSRGRKIRGIHAFEYLTVVARIDTINFATGLVSFSI